MANCEVEVLATLLDRYIQVARELDLGEIFQDFQFKSHVPIISGRSVSRYGLDLHISACGTVVVISGMLPSLVWYGDHVKEVDLLDYKPTIVGLQYSAMTYKT